MAEKFVRSVDEVNVHAGAPFLARILREKWEVLSCNNAKLQALSIAINRLFKDSDNVG